MATCRVFEAKLDEDLDDIYELQESIHGLAEVLKTIKDDTMGDFVWGGMLDPCPYCADEAEAAEGLSLHLSRLKSAKLKGNASRWNAEHKDNFMGAFVLKLRRDPRSV